MFNKFFKVFLSITLLSVCVLSRSILASRWNNQCYLVIENRSEYGLERTTSFIYRMLYFDFTFYIAAHSNGKGLIEPYEGEFNQIGKINYNVIGTNYNIQIGFETLQNLRKNIYIKYYGLPSLKNDKINLGYGSDLYADCVYYLQLSGYGRYFNVSTF